MEKDVGKVKRSRSVRFTDLLVPGTLQGIPILFHQDEKRGNLILARKFLQSFSPIVSILRFDSTSAKYVSIRAGERPDLREHNAPALEDKDGSPASTISANNPTGPWSNPGG